MPAPTPFCAASAWEIGTKFRIGKLPDHGELAFRFDAVIAQELFEPLPITSSHAVRAPDSFPVRIAIHLIVC